MRKGTWFLRILIGGLALLAIAAGLIPFPIMLHEMFEQAPHGLTMIIVILAVGIYLAIIGCLAAAFFAEQLLQIIDHNQAFSTHAVMSLTRVKWALVLVTTGIWLWLPFIYTIAQMDDAPGMMLIGLGIATIPLILTVFIAILARLWDAALRIKNENDLTI
ncbi:hypothetical protein IWT25_01915 [Secundilactobacillus pentosiphilus]|uniref:DUF2975 domain-containing protein n=1 Tax=Secundilactobacillus pentosiphilus TaxID=1714682 RepID=A0A1Z5IXN0_9LACO|nr:DUF2975 domain-containing protein [Secundilactobacillus pentosiphilus]GAX06570.1 hypothetical protein IWT25_01915 [Secundilactobacillus pentosiphilus]